MSDPLCMVEKDKADDDAEEDVLAAGGGSSSAKLKPRLTMIEQQVRRRARVRVLSVCCSVLSVCVAQSLLAVKQKKDKAVSDVLRKFKMSDLDEPVGLDKGRVTPRKK